MRAKVANTRRLTARDALERLCMMKYVWLKLQTRSGQEVPQQRYVLAANTISLAKKLIPWPNTSTAAIS